MNIILYLSSKYLKFKASERGISAIAIIALLTIIISCAAAVVILSAANGIHNNLMQKLMAKDFHAIILAPGKGIDNYEKYINNIKRIKGVVRVFPYFEKQVLLKGPLNVWGTVIMGIPPNLYNEDKEYKMQFQLNEGTFDLKDSQSIILGYHLAMNLGLEVGSIADLVVYSGDYLPLQYRFKVKGIFTAGHKDYDSALAFISFQDAQKVFDSIGYAYGIGVKVDNPMEIESYVDKLKSATPYFVYTWKNQHRNELAALQDEKMLLEIILFFFFCVVGFNILSTMIGMVLDKKEEIGILKAMGLKPSETLAVFLFDGFLLGMIGSLLGILTGLLITVTLNDILKGIEILFNFVRAAGFYAVRWIKPMPFPDRFQFFNSTVYYIDKFPIKIMISDVFFVIILAIVLSTLAVVVPALNASRFRPVEVLRND